MTTGTGAATGSPSSPHEPCSAAWARDWLLAEPDSADAAVLLACALVQRALRGKESPPRAREACRDRRRASRPPTPPPGSACSSWSATLGAGGRRGPRSSTRSAQRHADHHHAHHLMVARLAERRAEAGHDPLHEVYDFANWAAEQAPADSPLAILPVVAHAERYRVLAAAGQRARRPGRLRATGPDAGPAR